MKKEISPIARSGLHPDINRRDLIRGLAIGTLASPWFLGRSAWSQIPAETGGQPDERVAWVCPMHPQYISSMPGTCPLCGMTLVQGRPFDVRNYGLDLKTIPAVVRAGEKFTLLLTALRPGSGEPVTSFYWVHTKQWHLFVISQNMEYFQHIHPVMAADGTWSIDVVLPAPGYYEILSDFFPSGGTSQFIARPLVTAGYQGDLIQDEAHLVPDVLPVKKTIGDLTATISCDPPQLVAGQVCRIYYHLDDAKTGQPVTDLQTYLGTFGHCLMMSEDMVDYVHVHPLNILIGSDEDGAPPIILIPPNADLEKIRGGPDVILEALMPRAGHYRVWTQMRRHDVLHNFVATLNVAPRSEGVLL